MVTVGVLALQGAFAEHVDMLERTGATTKLVKRAGDLEGIDGLIIPGGESTTIARLTALSTDSLFSEIKALGQGGFPIYGTCMGMIFLAREIEGSCQGRLGLMDITVRRNAFGPQKFSFEELVSIPELGGDPFHCVFIRAPLVLAAAEHVQVLGKVAEGIVACRQGHLLSTAFHPELTNDTRVHSYFVSMIEESARQSGSARGAVPLGHNLATPAGIL